MAYSAKNSKGTTYFLHSKVVTLRGGRKQPIFYFGKTVNPETAIDAIPADRKVVENAKTGLLMLKKA